MLRVEDEAHVERPLLIGVRLLTGQQPEDVARDSVLSAQGVDALVAVFEPVPVDEH